MHEQNVAIGVRGHRFVDVPPEQAVDEASLPAADHDQIGVAFPREGEQSFRGIAELEQVLGLHPACGERQTSPFELMLCELVRLRARLAP